MINLLFDTEVHELIAKSARLFLEAELNIILFENAVWKRFVRNLPERAAISA